jgi:hypothetical protein
MIYQIELHSNIFNTFKIMIFYFKFKQDEKHFSPNRFF